MLLAVFFLVSLALAADCVKSYSEMQLVDFVGAINPVPVCRKATNNTLGCRQNGEFIGFVAKDRVSKSIKRFRIHIADPQSDNFLALIQAFPYGRTEMESYLANVMLTFPATLELLQDFYVRLQQAMFFRLVEPELTTAISAAGIPMYAAKYIGQLLKGEFADPAVVQEIQVAIHKVNFVMTQIEIHRHSLHVVNTPEFIDFMNFMDSPCIDVNVALNEVESFKAFTKIKQVGRLSVSRSFELTTEFTTSKFTPLVQVLRSELKYRGLILDNIFFKHRYFVVREIASDSQRDYEQEFEMLTSALSDSTNLIEFDILESTTDQNPLFWFKIWSSVLKNRFLKRLNVESIWLNAMADNVAAFHRVLLENNTLESIIFSRLPFFQLDEPKFLTSARLLIGNKNIQEFEIGFRSESRTSVTISDNDIVDSYCSAFITMPKLRKIVFNGVGFDAAVTAGFIQLVKAHSGITEFTCVETPSEIKKILKERNLKREN